MTLASVRGTVGRWNKAIGLTLCLLSGASVFAYVAREHYGPDLVRFEPQLLTIAVTFAVFAVNFSFLEYQLSPYRQTLRGIAWPHVNSAAIVLVLALVPIAAAVAGHRVSTIAAFVIPLIAASSIVLALIARYCADPLNKVRVAASEKCLARFIDDFASAAAEEIKQSESLRLTVAGDSPAHEWDYRVPPTISFNDPFDVLYSIAAVAVAAGDGRIFDESVEAILSAGYVVASARHIKLKSGEEAGYKVEGLILGHVEDRLLQLARLTLETDKTDRFSRSFVEILGSFLRVEAANSRQADAYSRAVMSCVAFVAEESLKRGWRTSALGALVIARECAGSGLEKPKQDDYPSMFYDSLTYYVRIGQSLAECAMKEKNTEFLYRCLDMLGYLGCSSVKHGASLVGQQCLQSLSQIARVSRSLGLQCFWTRCGMLPWQHARKRMEWMLTWVAKVPAEDQNLWLETFSEAYSRVEGKTIEISLIEESGKPLFQLNKTQKAHKVTYSDEDWVTYDYSDENMLRDLQLY